jgi:Protein of unknown function (DUF4031)
VSVYVDTMRAKFRAGMIMCHMVADTLTELHEMALQVGLRREWFQDWPEASFPHYDITLSKRKLALEFGAVEVDRHQLVAVMRRYRTNVPERLAEVRTEGQK